MTTKKVKNEFNILNNDYFENLELLFNSADIGTNDKIKLFSILDNIENIRKLSKTNKRKQELSKLIKSELKKYTNKDKNSNLNLFFNKNENKILKKYSFRIDDDCYIIDNNNKIILDNDKVYFDKYGFYYYFFNPKFINSINKESKKKK